MNLGAIVDMFERRGWVQPVDTVLSSAASTLFSPTTSVQRRLKNVLHGTWLGHPLHVTMSDVPIGAWTTALTLDGMELATGDEAYGKGADAAIALGVAAATGLVLSGINDWQYLVARARSTGVVHATLNAAAGVLYTASLVCRRTGARGAGRALAVAGYGFTFSAAYLGGDLVLAEKIGTDQSKRLERPADFTPVIAEAELAPNAPHMVKLDGTPVLVVRMASGRIYAIQDTCSHEAGPLHQGRLEDHTIVCPWHGSRFSLEDGRVLDGPATFPQQRYDVRVRNGQVELRVLS